MRKFHRPICFALSFLLFCLIPLNAVASSSSEPLNQEVFQAISAQSHCVMDADTGEVLSSANGNTSFPMASTTKIMTCIVALENSHFSDETVISQNAVGVEGSSVYLIKDEKLSLGDLLYALMLESANDAAVAVAEAVCGSVEAFVGKMNDKARELELSGTRFANPHGLSAEGHFTTANDLAKLMAYCMENETFSAIVATQTKSIPGPEGHRRFLSNHNRLLKNYEYCIGGKTGYTKEAGRCLVTVSEKEGKRLVCSTLGAPDDWNDHIALYESAFPLYSERRAVSAGEYELVLSVVGGKSDSVRVSNLSPIAFPVRPDQKCIFVTEAPRFLYAPVVIDGSEVGSLVLYVDGVEVSRSPLICSESVEQEEIQLGFWQKLWLKLRSIFEG